MKSRVKTSIILLVLFVLLVASNILNESGIILLSTIVLFISAQFFILQDIKKSSSFSFVNSIGSLLLCYLFVVMIIASQVVASSSEGLSARVIATVFAIILVVVLLIMIVIAVVLGRKKRKMLFSADSSLFSILLLVFLAYGYYIAPSILVAISPSYCGFTNYFTTDDSILRIELCLDQALSQKQEAWEGCKLYCNIIPDPKYCETMEYRCIYANQFKRSAEYVNYCDKLQEEQQFVCLQAGVEIHAAQGAKGYVTPPPCRKLGPSEAECEKEFKRIVLQNMKSCYDLADKTLRWDCMVSADNFIELAYPGVSISNVCPSNYGPAEYIEDCKSDAKMFREQYASWEKIEKVH